MGLNRDFWQDKSVFVTGHTGFKGSWLSVWLQRLGAKIYGYALKPSSSPNLFDAARVEDGMHSTVADVRNYPDIQKAMQTARPQIAFHLAAQPLVRASYDNPVDTFAANVMGTVNFLEAVRNTPSIRVAVIVTSDKCYENDQGTMTFRETDRMGGNDPYSSSKGCAELVTAAYRRSFFNDGKVAIATVRAGNVIGGGDWADDRLIPDLIRAFAKQRPLTLRYPQAVRPWQHVLEPLRGYLMLAEQLWHNPGVSNGGWNFGPNGDDAWPVVDVVRTAARIWGQGARWTADTKASLHEAHYLNLDCTLAREKLSWSPVTHLEQALDWTLSWYRCHLDGTIDMRKVTEAQIARYEELAMPVGDNPEFRMGACCGG
jgi:CDP-glucose 4,6-dehydratase